MTTPRVDADRHDDGDRDHPDATPTATTRLSRRPPATDHPTSAEAPSLRKRAPSILRRDERPTDRPSLATLAFG